MGQAIQDRGRQPPAQVARERRGARPLELAVFRQDVVAGLSRPQKSLPPKYFYDAAGSRLFARICRLRSEEHTSELQSQSNLVCRFLLKKKSFCQKLIDV